MALPVFSLGQVAKQLQTQWGGEDEGTTRTWSDGNGNPNGIITYSLPDTSPERNGKDAGEPAGFTVMTATQKAFAREAFELWDDLIASRLDETTSTNAQITLAFSSTTDKDGTYTTPFLAGQAPGSSTFNRQIDHERIWFSQSGSWLENQSANMAYGERGLENMLHEIGHSLGLSHPGSYNESDDPKYAVNAEYSQDTQQYSVMSYFAPGADVALVDRPVRKVAGTSDVNNDGINASTPLLHDILAIQAKYGADMTTRTGDTVYGFHSTANRGVFDFNLNKNPVIAIWDAGGEDRLDCSGFTQDQRIDLHEGSFSDVGALTKNVAIAYNCYIENASGGSGNDSITGNDGDNILNGLAGNDKLFGVGGADVLHGNEGNDTLDGGVGFIDTLFGDSGNDTYIVNDLDVIHEANGGGTDTVRSSIGWALSDNEELEYLVLTGTGNINGFGNSLDNLILGNSGNNYLGGGLGYDTLFGGAGNDTYALGDAKLINGAYTWDKVIESAGEGIDTVYASADVGRYTYQLEANVENLVATGVSTFRLWGNELDNALTGNNAANELAGFAGNDTLDGHGGLDTLAGGLGNDTYVLGDLASAGAYANFFFDTVSEAANEGTDTVLVASLADPNRLGTNHYTLTANVENGTITGADVFNLTGNDLDNVLTGNAAANTLSGAGGADTLKGGDGLDTLAGGEGNDRYYLGDLSKTSRFAISAYDTVTENAGAGVDTVYVTAFDNPDTFASVERYTLGANIENGVVQGALAFNLTGNDGNNTLAGNDAANTLSGGVGNDLLLGAAGFDTLIGGVGDDTYVLADLSWPSKLTGFIYDAVNEAAGEGTDTVVVRAMDDPDTLSTVETYTLGDNIENGAIDGSLAFNLAGNALANALTGNSGANKLDGKAGGDKLAGGGGADILVGGAGRDILTGGDGDDDFDFNAVSETGKTAATRDRITDFVHGVDDIDLATIDANSKAAGNQKFAFIGTAAFHHKAGELHYTKENPSGTAHDMTIVSGDINGDGKADFHIELTGLKTLTSGDFML